jgi:hypothetical protein
VAALRRLFDWLAIGQVLAVNPMAGKVGSREATVVEEAGFIRLRVR